MVTAALQVDDLARLQFHLLVGKIFGFKGAA